MESSLITLNTKTHANIDGLVIQTGITEVIYLLLMEYALVTCMFGQETRKDPHNSSDILGHNEELEIYG